MVGTIVRLRGKEEIEQLPTLHTLFGVPIQIRVVQTLGWNELVV
jgi:hypothetical protein